ncbi:restriction endonuclease subunit S [Capnocytophaga leadbetteri]|uniref:restriction endonuclease subunit S n=1 Tax=Capnocytophaga leadbetteri TaxID=327575 RepID=UPI00350E5B65
MDEEIPFEIPNGWEWCIIGNLFNHNNGKQLNRSNSSGELMSYITTSNLYWNGFILNNLKKMPFEIKEIERCQAIKGDLLVCEGGDIGRSCIWENDEPIMLQNHIHKLRAYLPLCTRYFYYIFYLYNLSGLIGGKGIGIQGFSSQTLHTTRIPLPPLAEQQRIVEKIEELIPHIELYGKAQTELDTLNKNIKEQLKKSVLQYAIGGKLVPQDEAEGTAEELLLQIQAEKQKLYEENKLKKKDLEHSTIFKGEDNKYYEKIGKNVTEITDDMLLDLPVGWRWCRLKDIVFIFTGATFKKEEVSVENIDIRILRGGNIQPFRLTNRVDDIFLPKDKVKENILLKKNDIVTPAVTSLENIGKMARVESDLESTTVGGFVLILRQFYCNDIVSKYLLALLSSPVLIDYIKSITNKSGQAFYNISKNRLEMTLLPLPPLAEQQRIVESIDAIFRCIEN